MVLETVLKENTNRIKVLFGQIVPRYARLPMIEKYCREGGIFHEKGKNEIFRFEKLENLKIRKEVTR